MDITEGKNYMPGMSLSTIQGAHGNKAGLIVRYLQFIKKAPCRLDGDLTKKDNCVNEALGSASVVK